MHSTLSVVWFSRSCDFLLNVLFSVSLGLLLLSTNHVGVIFVLSALHFEVVFGLACHLYGSIFLAWVFVIFHPFWRPDRPVIKTSGQYFILDMSYILTCYFTCVILGYLQ